MGRSVLALGSLKMLAWFVPIAEISVEPSASVRSKAYTEADCAGIMEDLNNGIGIEYPVLCRLLWAMLTAATKAHKVAGSLMERAETDYRCGAGISLFREGSGGRLEL